MRVDDGLSHLGLEVIDALERHGVLLDLSHAGYQTARDALDAASEPVVLSYSNPKAVWDNPRNIPDDIIKAVAEAGGTIGVNAFSGFFGQGPPLEPQPDNRRCPPTGRHRLLAKPSPRPAVGCCHAR